MKISLKFDQRERFSIRGETFTARLSPEDLFTDKLPEGHLLLDADAYDGDKHIPVQLFCEMKRGELSFSGELQEAPKGNA